MSARAVIAAALLAIAGHVIAGQAPAPQVDGPPSPTFRIQVDAVELDAAVTDAQGNPVTDLTIGDFELLEDGKPQTIASFRLVNVSFDRGERPLISPRTIEPDVLTNDHDEGRLYVIALDEVQPLQALRIRRFVRRFIERHFGPNDLGAIALIGRAAGVAQELTGNPRLLLDAIDKYSGGMPADPFTLGPTGPAAGAPRPPSAINEATLVMRTGMASLRKLAEFMAGIHGRRKAMLLFSEGFSLDLYKVLDYKGGTLAPGEEDAHFAMTAATRGNVTIYPIDPRGLTVNGDISDDAPAERDIVGEMDARSGLRALAEATGGFAITNSNSFDTAFARIVKENSSYYVLGFSSTNDRRDGKFRKLILRVKRPGLQVRSRGGYMAPLRREKPAVASKPTDLSPAVAEALASAVAVPGVPIRVFAAPYKSASREATVAISIEVDASRLGLVEQNGAYVGALQVGLAAISSRDKVVSGGTTTSKLALKPETYAEVMRGGFRILSEIKLPAGRHQLRVAAGNQSGSAGSVVYDIEVPDYSKEPIVMSGVSITSSSASKVTTIRPKDPLAGILPSPITASRDFAAGDELTLFVEVYENLRNQSAHAITLTTQLRADDGRVVRTVADQRSSGELQAPGASQKDRAKSGGFGFTPAIPLTGVAAGLYVIHVEAQSNIGSHATVSRDVQIRVR